MASDIFSIMPGRIIASDAAPKAIGPYSQAVLVEQASGSTLYCAGQIPLDPATVQVAALPKGARVEIEVVAVK